MRIARIISLLFAMSCAIRVPFAQDQPVDVALVLAVDISASVDEQEHRLQMIGLAAALQSDALLEAILAAPRKRIAIAVTQWSGARAQYLLVPWVIIDSEAAARDLSRRLLLARRADDGGGTSISAALTHAGQLFAVAPPATRRVIDVSTDGINNVGPPLPPIRARLATQGITVNSLAIAAEWPKLSDYLDENVIAGTAAFSVTAKRFEDFGAAMLVKLLREVRGPGLS